MSEKLQPLRGMKDLFFEECALHEYIIATARKISSLYNYQGASVPILEYTRVFDRTLGDTSDVVSKEMYSFLDRSGESVALRPEFTAGIMRAVISGGMQHKLPLKLFSHGPVFRYDRPQAGRQRQFHQINCEYIGSDQPYADAEIIKLAMHLLNNLGLDEDVTLELNSLGCRESRLAYQQALDAYFSKYQHELSEDSKNRLAKNNALRILDSKDETDKKISMSAPLISDYYTAEAKKYFDQVREHLDTLQVNYTLNPRLARGLDYYCHTAFEFTTDKLGAQSTVIGGGRYDYLCEMMGGAPTAAIGFASGIERLAIMLQKKGFTIQSQPPVFLLPIGEESESYLLSLADLLRQNSIAAVLETKGKLQKRMEKALKNNANYIIFAGSEEMQNGTVKLKNLTSKEEQTIETAELLKILQL